MSPLEKRDLGQAVLYLLLLIAACWGGAAAIVYAQREDMRCTPGESHPCPGGGFQYCEQGGERWSTCLVTRFDVCRQ